MIQDCTLFRYEFDDSNFIEIDNIAGYYVSTSIEIPLEFMRVQVVMTDMDSFVEIKNLVVNNLSAFSIIKWDNLTAK